MLLVSHLIYDVLSIVCLLRLGVLGSFISLMPLLTCDLLDSCGRLYVNMGFERSAVGYAVSGVKQTSALFTHALYALPAHVRLGQCETFQNSATGTTHLVMQCRIAGLTKPLRQQFLALFYRSASRLPLPKLEGPAPKVCVEEALRAACLAFL